MSAIRSKNTSPELRLRKELFTRGFRYKLHVRQLPGVPDIVLSKFRTAIQVRGCFWHQHHCRDGHMPRSSVSYWKPKLLRNSERDKKNDLALMALGWKLEIVWECEIRSQTELSIKAKGLAQVLTKRARELLKSSSS